MIRLDPDLALFAVPTSAVGYSMLVAGIAKKRLRWRRPHPCPTCGGRPCRCRFFL